MSEVAKHNSPDDCWVVLCGKVYDLTAFHASHPGGSRLITGAAGKDATAAFLQHHPKDFADRLLGPSAVVGAVDASTIEPQHLVRVSPEPSAAAAAAAAPSNPGDLGGSGRAGEGAAGASGGKPPLNAILNAFDFESVAAGCMDPKGWAYYSSGADDEITLRENHLAFQRVWLKPRILVDVKEVRW